MIKRVKRLQSPSPAPRRSGLTLTEVLMSLLAVGVGVASIAALFPLSVLRSIEATQLTGATMHRYNAEEMIDGFPGLVFDPDGDGDGNEHSLPGANRYIIDPLGVFGIPAPGDTQFAGIATLPRFAGALPSGAIVDPNIARSIATSKDSWATILDREAQLSGYVAGTPSIVMAGSFEATGVAAAPYQAAAGEPVYRIILFDILGTRSHTKIVNQIAADGTIDWTDPLPNNFTPATALLQLQEQHYSWMLTVRRETAATVSLGPPFVSDESAIIDVVVFFNRPIGNVETAYPLREDGFQIGVDNVTIDWTGNPEPFLRTGKFIFDPDNALWYRIVDIEELTDTSATLYLDRGAEADSTTAGGAGELGLAVFMEGIVDVFPIKRKSARYSF